VKRTVIGNWKMNLSLAEAEALAQATTKIAERYPALKIVIAPSLPWLVPLKESLRFTPANFAFASQVVSHMPEGAYTGDVSAKQLKGLVTYGLVGHSERRRDHHESGAIISDQIRELLGQNITPVVCFGEQSQSKQTAFSTQITVDLQRDLEGLDKNQLEQCLFAYEPLWAIGTGDPASPDYIKKAIAHVKNWSNELYNLAFPILYGGSVSEDNAEDLGRITELDGLLVGGASLQAKRFSAICALFSGHV
jgi:triosephosphate isomerase